MNVRRSCFIVLILLFSFCFIQPLKAQSLSYRLDKSKVRLIIPPAGSQTGAIKIYNQSKEILKIKVYAEDWLYEKVQDGAKQFYPAATTAVSCAKWISYSPAEFTVPAFGVNTVNFNVNVPQDASGSYVAVLFFETNTSDLPQGNEVGQQTVQSGVGLALRIGSLFYVDVKGKTNRTAEVTNFTVTKDTKGKSFFFSADFKNNGNADITTEGTYHITDKKGMIYARGKFNSVYTLPGDTAKLQAVWNDPIPAGTYDVVITLDLGKAIEEADLGRGPIMIKEASLQVNVAQEVAGVGPLQ